MKIHTNQRSLTDFIHAVKTVHTDIYQRFLNIYGQQIVDVRTIRWCVINFGSSENDICNKVHSVPSCKYVNSNNEEHQKINSQWW